jgi:DNA replication and repair protein RecF
MTRIRQINLLQFKNHTDASYTFTSRVTGITGKNGCGKTNLLDALYYLCFARSYFAHTDSSLVGYGKQGFRITGLFEQEGTATIPVSCVLRENGTKELQAGDEVCKKLSAYIGRFSCVMIAPDDIEIINSSGGALRRRFLDTILCQTNSAYLEALQKYNKILLQRNSLLKQFSQEGMTDPDLLDTYDSQLVSFGHLLFTARTQLAKELQPMVMDYYKQLAGTDDAIQIEYESQLAGSDFAVLLKQNRQRDVAAQRTTCGIHKDDVEINMQRTPLRLSASQGQKKSVLLSLKLTELDFLKRHMGTAPILLLDDMFERLDPERVSRLLQLVTSAGGGQVFITDTNEDQLKRYLEMYEADFSLLRLSV